MLLLRDELETLKNKMELAKQGVAPSEDVKKLQQLELELGKLRNEAQKVKTLEEAVDHLKKERDEMTDTQVTWLTQESHDRLKEELDQLIAAGLAKEIVPARFSSKEMTELRAKIDEGSNDLKPFEIKSR